MKKSHNGSRLGYLCFKLSLTGSYCFRKVRSPYHQSKILGDPVQVQITERVVSRCGESDDWVCWSGTAALTKTLPLTNNLGQVP